MRMGIRGRFKSITPKVLWPAFRFFDKYLIHSLYVYFALKRSICRFFCKRHSLPPQPVPLLFSHIDFGSYPGDNLDFHLDAAHITYKSGRHSVYIESYEDIAKINPEITQKYPYPVALKLIKSQELAPDATPYYTSRRLAPASTWFSMVAIGSMFEQAVVSNLLNDRNVAPRVYDIVHLQSESGSWRYAYVVQPIKGEVVTGNAGIQFVARFKKAMEQLGMETMSIQEHCDLRPPEFRNNIISDTNGIYYVDIQNFVLADRRFGDKLLLTMEQRKLQNRQKSGKPCIGSVDTSVNLAELFQKCGVSIKKTVCVDILTEDESLAIEALAAGCIWCHLARFENDISLVKRYLYYHGYSRFCLSEYDIEVISKNTIFKRLTYPKVLFLSAKGIGESTPLVREQFAEYLLLAGTEGESGEDLTALHEYYEPSSRVLAVSRVSLSNNEVLSVLLSRQLGHE